MAGSTGNRRTGALLLGAWVTCAALGDGVAAQQGETDNAALTAQVEAREIAFARTMADRDLEAFSGFVADDAVFFAGDDSAIRGRAAVVEAWSGFFDGPDAPFSWAPDHVEVLTGGDLAHSSGPVLNAAGEQVGRFNTIWRRQADGRWLVVFDKGCPA